MVGVIVLRIQPRCLSRKGDKLWLDVVSREVVMVAAQDAATAVQARSVAGVVLLVVACVSATGCKVVTMLCKKPYIAPGMVAHPCGQCMHCRANWSRKWVLRMLLEASTHEASSFLTLTYDDDHLPRDGKLHPRHLTLFLKGARKNGLIQRYFAVGEYGRRSRRPHYHAILFGSRPPQLNRDLCIPADPKHKSSCGCHAYQKLWHYGGISIGNADQGAMVYCAQYSAGKLSDGASADDEWRPFFRQSRRPGLGLEALDDIASSLLFAEQRGAVLHDVPTSLRIFGKSWPLDRYVRAALRVRMGRDPKAPKEVLYAHQEKLQPLREAAKLRAQGIPNYLYDAFRDEIYLSREAKHHQVSEALKRNRKVQL